MLHPLLPEGIGALIVNRRVECTLRQLFHVSVLVLLPPMLLLLLLHHECLLVELGHTGLFGYDLRLVGPAVV